MSTLIKNATIVNFDSEFVGDLLIDGEIIRKIGVDLNFHADRVIDAKGHYLFPGGIDAHTHMELPVMGTFSSDDFESGTKAALHGGTTTIIDFANQMKGESLHLTLDKWLKKAEKKSFCDYSFHVSVTDVNETSLSEISELVERGVTSFKTFLAYAGMRLSDGDLRLLMKEIKNVGGMVTCHCEMGDQVEKKVDEFVTLGKLEPKFHSLSRPSSVEGEATGHFLNMAMEENVKAYVVHMTCKESVNHLRGAKKKSLSVFGETCPQYLFLDDSLYDQKFPEASKYILSPPLRKQQDQEAVWNGLFDDTLDVLATDHCPFTLEQRRVGKDNFTNIPNGLPGVEERMVLLFSEGVMKEKITPSRFVALTSYNPAKLFGLLGKGQIKEGFHADLILIDPRKKSVLSSSTHHMKVDYSCYEGKEVQGKITHVFRRGELMVEQNKFVGRNPGSYQFRELT